MKKKLLLWFAFVVVMGIVQTLLGSCTGSFGDSGHTYQECSETFVADNVTGEADSGDATYDVALIDFADGFTHEEIMALAEREGLSLTVSEGESVVDTNYYLARVPEGDVAKLRAHMKAHYGAHVEHVEENVRYKAYAWSPNDPLRQFQWHFDQIATEEAWTMSTGRGSVVAVLDTGIALYDTDKTIRLRDLQNVSTAPGYDFIDDDDVPYDLQGHGSHVAGTIAQDTNNNYGTSGVAYNATLMAVRVLDAEGYGTSDGVARGIVFAADNGAHVINLSLGSSQKSATVQEAIHYARSKGVTVIAAAGNGGKRQPNYPAASEGVISVAATQYDKHPTFYSQWGPNVDIAAPGGNVRLDQNKDGKPDGVLQETIVGKNPKKGQFALYMGTSMAAPHVAGTAALINQWGVTHPTRVEQYLMKGADTERLQKEETGDDPEKVKPKDKEEDKPSHYSPKEFRERYGAGIIQADSAVTAAIIEPGVLRMLLALIFGCLMFVLSRQVNLLEADLKLLGTYLITAAIMAAGFFLLPFIVPGMEHTTVATITQYLGTPVMAWDWLILHSDRLPITSSALIPGLIAFLLYGFPRLRYLGAGIATGSAAFLAAEAILLTMPLMWIPGGDLVARLFFGVNALALLIAVYFILAKDVVLPNKD